MEVPSEAPSSNGPPFVRFLVEGGPIGLLFALGASLVIAFARVRLVVEDSLPYRAAGWALWRDHRVFVPFATIQNWVEAGGKKGR